MVIIEVARKSDGKVQTENVRVKAVRPHSGCTEHGFQCVVKAWWGRAAGR
jgi:hypothetical protein